ncbi:Na+/H+ antiporter subunit D [Plantactinospora sp. KBS50]|uniref:Na+/H+ antiporter subunit D n=1 Tax=Plantactinospora sp. KBS50 TaxID=2024580 RepID=UPI000BAB1DC2|nr:Na+/H+ antiporter subunit D [Plantactinospora sp. KBS50]ASW54109.1 Na+/H+ antiporter subunit D [Plantactinospora sp. KBS50]
MSRLVVLPVMLPLLGAALTLILAGRPRAQRTVSVLVLAATLVTAVLLLWAAIRHGTLVAEIGGWAAPAGIVLVADQFATLMLVVSVAVTLAVLCYAVGQGQAGDQEAPVSVFHPTYLVLTAGVANAFLAGDLFNLFVSFEVLLAASYVLIMLGGTDARLRVGTTYVVVSLLSSMVFLSAIGLVYAATGTVNLAQLVGRLDALPANLQIALQSMLLLAFGVKAAVFPLSAWLPDSYPSAPTPVTAVFAGLLTKVGVYAIIRTETLLFPGRRAADVLLVLALLTMLVGILGALVQTDIKRLLSFTLVSHIGYLLFGVALTSVAGLAGAIFYVLHHITIQTTLFLSAGLVERRVGSTDLNRLGGLARSAPLLGILFLVPAVNLAGIPPFSGFLGKLGLLEAGAAEGGVLPWSLVAAGSLTSLLTLYAVVRVWNLAFWRPVPMAVSGYAEPPELVDPAGREIQPGATGAGNAARPRSGARPESGDGSGDGSGSGGDRTPRGSGPDGGDPERLAAPVQRVPRMMIGATAALVALGLAFTVLAGPLYRVATEAATDLRMRTPYVQAVFPGGAP